MHIIILDESQSNAIQMLCLINGHPNAIANGISGVDLQEKQKNRIEIEQKRKCFRTLKAAPKTEDQLAISFIFRVEKKNIIVWFN